MQYTKYMPLQFIMLFNMLQKLLVTTLRLAFYFVRPHTHRLRSSEAKNSQFFTNVGVRTLITAANDERKMDRKGVNHTAYTQSISREFTGHITTGQVLLTCTTVKQYWTGKRQYPTIVVTQSTLSKIWLPGQI